MAGRFGDAAPLYCGVVSNSTTGLVMAASRRRAWPSRFLLRGPAVIFDALAFFCRLVAGITTAVSDLSSHTQHRPLLLVESNAKPHEVQYCLGRWRGRGEQRGENKGGGRTKGISPNTALERPGRERPVLRHRPGGGRGRAGQQLRRVAPVAQHLTPKLTCRGSGICQIQPAKRPKLAQFSRRLLQVLVA